MGEKRVEPLSVADEARPQAAADSVLSGYGSVRPAGRTVDAAKPGHEQNRLHAGLAARDSEGDAAADERAAGGARGDCDGGNQCAGRDEPAQMQLLSVALLFIF